MLLMFMVIINFNILALSTNVKEFQPNLDDYG